MEEQRDRTGGGISVRLLASAVVPVIILGAMIAFLLSPMSGILTIGTPLPEVTIERIEFHEGMIVAHVRNTGPGPVQIAQADVDDRIVPAAIEPSKDLGRFAEARVVIPYAWNAGQPYEVGVTTSDGTRFAKEVAAAALAPQPSASQVSFFALLGTYVGIIPVLIGLLWYPFMKRLPKNLYIFFLSLTAGLLLFLGIDALVEANEIVVDSIAGAFRGQLLIVTGAVLSFLVLTYLSDRLVSRAGTRNSATQGPAAIALMVAIGIGLHNLGEGLAIAGAMALGELALGTFLIIGFTLHNTTEGLAIVAPLAKQRPKILHLVALGIIAGGPAIVGAWIGGFVSSPIASVLFLSVGAGAVFQVIVSIAKFVKSSVGTSLLTGSSIAGISAGMLIMYLTALLI
ncbi:MAG TPA: divalent cation transporter [Nitrososphaera sp.]|nr:divalent cation transporter [Nitrososphaera sp.]